MELYDLYSATIEQIQIGGIFMFPLILTCFTMWIIIFKKLFDLYFLTRGDRPADEIIHTIGKPGFSAALWQKQILDGYLKERTSDNKLNARILSSLNIRQKSNLYDYISTISILAGIAPLLGLLGTVNGMVKTFDVIAVFGTGNARMLAAGISEALITTETGLVVAVPGLFFASFIIRRSDELLARISRFCILLQNAQINVK